MPECAHPLNRLSLEFYQRDIIDCEACGARWTRNSVFENLGYGGAVALFNAFIKSDQAKDQPLQAFLAEGKTVADLQLVVHQDAPEDPEDSLWRDKS